MSNLMSTDSKAAELKPCPFCGGPGEHCSKGVAHYEKGIHWVKCNLCHAETSSSDTENEAAEDWNTRALRPVQEPSASEPVAEVIECPFSGQQTLVEIDGRWKFLRYGDKLYAAPQPAAPAVPGEPILAEALTRLRNQVQWLRHGTWADVVLGTTVVHLEAIVRHFDAAQPAPDRVGMTDAARDVLAERQRQISVEGWTPAHDDEHDDGALSMAAVGYASGAADKIFSVAHELDEDFSLDDDVSNSDPGAWPHGWDFKPCTPRRALVKAGALILAELERLDRAHSIQAMPKEGAHPPTEEQPKCQ